MRYVLSAADLAELAEDARDQIPEAHDTENCPECKLEADCLWAEIGY